MVPLCVMYSCVLMATVMTSLTASDAVHISNVGNVSNLWLRDHCAACGNWAAIGSGSRGWGALLALEELGYLLAGIRDLDDEVIIFWRDGMNETFTKKWLRRHALHSKQTEDPLNTVGPGLNTIVESIPEQWLSDRVPWAAGHSIPHLDFTHSVGKGSARWRLNFLQTLRRHGAVLLDNAPENDDPDIQRAAIDQVLQVTPAPWGAVWSTNG
jgi:hypothetical protein